MRPRLAIAAALLFASMVGVAAAHLLPKQDATLHVDGDKGYLVVSVPASALVGIDDDVDGALTPQEIARHEDSISRQFLRRFHVSSPEGDAPFEFVWISNPAESVAATDPRAHTSYVVVMAGARFPEAPSSVFVRTDLFGDAEDERRLNVRARRGERSERAVLARSAPAHEFFGRGACSTDC